MTYEVRKTVYGGDTDYSGRIYTASVVDKLIEALQAFRASFGYPNTRLYDAGHYPVARNVDVDYLGEVNVDDELALELDASIGTTSVEYEFTGTVDGEPVVGGTVTCVWVDADNGDAIEVPADVRAGIEAAVAPEPE